MPMRLSRSRHRRWIVAGSATAAVLLSLVFVTGAAAHVRWFVPDPNLPVRGDLIGSFESAITFASAVAAIAVLWAAASATRRWHPTEWMPGLASTLVARMTPRDAAPLYRAMPVILAVHLAAALLLRATQRDLLVPNLHLPFTLAAGILALGEILVALGLLVGAATRVWALGLAGLWLAGVGYFGPLLMLEHAYILGIAFFLGVTGRGPRAFDRLTPDRGHAIARLLPWAVPTLRITFGVATIISGFTEKLLNPRLAAEFLAGHPLNVTATLPGVLRLDDAGFAVAAGMGEVVLGALLVSGLWPRLVALIAWTPFNLAVPFLGAEDLLGHLPIYGILLVLLVCGDGRAFATALPVDSASEDRRAARPYAKRQTWVGAPALGEQLDTTPTAQPR